MASGVLLAGLANGVIFAQSTPSGPVLPAVAHSVFVYQRGTTTQVQVYSDSGLTLPVSQPLLTGVAGGVPGYVAGGQSVDVFDSTTNLTNQAEPLSASSVASASSPPASAGLIPVATGSGSSAIAWDASPYVVCRGYTPAAIRAAIAALPTISHPIFGSIQWGTVKLPPGVYTWSSSDAVVNIPSYVHIDGLKRAIMMRGLGYTGLLFSAASAITQFALNGLVWDNNYTNIGTNYMMWQFPNGCTEFDHLWARYQDLNSAVGQMAGGASLNDDVNVEDVRLYAVGSPSNQPSLEFYDTGHLSIKRVKTLVGSGTTSLQALSIQALGSAPAMRVINIEDVEGDRCGAMMIDIRNNNSGVMETVTVKGLKGTQIGSATVPKGLLNIGEQVVGTPGQSTTAGIIVEDAECRDWWGAMVSIGSQASGGGNVYDWAVTDLRGDAATVAGSVDTTRNSSLLNTTAQYGKINGARARNCGLGGVRFLTSTFQSAAHIEGEGIDVESCVQNPAPSSFPSQPWKETGVFIDVGCNDLRLKGRSVNNYSAANTGGSSVGAGVGTYTNGTTQTNDIWLDFECTDTRAGGSQFQDVGIRIGQADSDANQPNRWTIIGGDLRNNGVQAIKQYGTTDHGHIITQNKGDQRVLSGTGTPNSKVTGSVGDIYVRTDGTTAVTLYVKESGTNTTSGWVPKGPNASLITATNASWPIPEGATLLEITCVGGGGGGGGGGAATGTTLQVGGSGGSAAMASTQVVAVGANTTLNVTIGVGGTGGNGGTAPGGAGTAGSGAGNTTVTGTGISAKGRAAGGGNPSAGNSTTAVQATAFGSAVAAKQDSQGGPGLGGTSGAAGGDALGSCGAGGGGGGPATTTLGGGGGGAGTQTDAGTAGTSGASGTAAGVAGSAAAANTGAGGGGGGGGAAGTGAGGAGGNGGSGFAVIKVVG